MTGNYEGQNVTLIPNHWIQQPPGYNMVGLAGELHGDTLSGTIMSPGCGPFSVTKVTAATDELQEPVTVVESGFSQETSSSATNIHFGVELRDKSQILNALGVAVTATFVDKYGRSGATDSATLTAIPATKTFYYAGYAYSNVSLVVTGMHLSVVTTDTRPTVVALPPVNGVEIAATALGENNITGRFRNPYAKIIPSDATIYVVFLNATGHIVGGTLEPSGASVEPGATVSFSVSEYPPPPIAGARAWVDPCSWQMSTLALEGCPISVPSITS